MVCNLSRWVSSLTVRVLFGGAKRVGEPMRRAARAKRCLLAFMRRPSGQRDDLETGRYPPIPPREPVIVNLGRAQEQPTLARRPAAAEKRVLLAHATKIRHQPEHVRIGDGQPVGLGNRQRQPGAAKQSTNITDIGHRRGARAGAAEKLLLGLEKRGSQFAKRRPAKKADKAQAVRLQKSAYLRHDARQIIDPVQQQAGKDGVKTAGGERQPVIIDRNSGSFGGRHGGEGGCRVRLYHPPHLSGLHNLTRQPAIMTAEIKTEGKITPDHRQPVGHPDHRLAFQKVEPGEPGRGAGPVATLRGGVEKTWDGRTLGHDGRTITEAMTKRKANQTR